MREIILSSVVALFLLNGCGASSSTSTSDNNGDNLIDETTEVKKTGTGYYVDSAVEGVDYLCGSQSGTTDENGTFIFEEGEDCNFTIGGLVLREINASSLEDNITILEDNVEVAQLLQTLDMDGNATNGITIDNNSTSRVVADIHIEEIPTELAVLDSIKEALKAESEEYKGRVKTREEAKDHLDETEKDLKDRGIKTQRRESSENRPENGNEGVKNTNENRPDNGNEGVKDTNETRPDNGNEGVRDTNENRPDNGNEGMKDTNETRPDNGNEGVRDTNENRPKEITGGNDATENQPTIGGGGNSTENSSGGMDTTQGGRR